MMNYTTTRIHGLYSFTLLTGEAYRTTYSPKEISQLYCFDAIDKEGNLKVILTADVNFKSFEYIEL
jgi:hypothetical protein